MQYMQSGVEKYYVQVLFEKSNPRRQKKKKMMDSVCEVR